LKLSVIHVILLPADISNEAIGNGSNNGPQSAHSLTQTISVIFHDHWAIYLLAYWIRQGLSIMGKEAGYTQGFYKGRAISRQAK
jgi:hypothetical protein